VALEPVHTVARYLFTWDGIALGALALEINDTASIYSLHVQVHSVGIVNLFTHHTSDTTVTGLHIQGGYQPLHYESHYKTKNKPRHIILLFDKAGRVTEETVEPRESRNERPDVPHALKDGSRDPLSTLMEIRAGQSGFHGFDAQRLYEVKSAAGANATLRIAGTPRPAVRYILSRTPLAGMTAKEMREYAKGEPPLTLFFSDDAERIPLMVSVPFFGRITGILVQECKTWQECALQ
jgi:hypothetical protein